MANRFWVGGNGTWSATDTTNWSDTSGGAGGASAPTSADDVYFDDNSDAGSAFTVTIGTGAVCRDITAGSLDFVMTLAGSAAWAISGSLTFPATNLTRTYTGTITFNATTTGKTITTNGVALANNILLQGTGGEWTLGSAIVVGGGSFNIDRGSFSTNNFNITANSFISSNSNIRSVNLGSSIISVGGTIAIAFATTTNITFDAGTSQINVTNAGSTTQGGGLTFYNLTYTSTAAGNPIIQGANTFNDLTFTSLAATGIRNISIEANQTINGTLTFGTDNTAIRRMFVRSDVIGTARTLTAATVATLADVDFRDIVGAGLGTWSGTRLGNCGGNTGITFDASKDVYRVGTGNWSATQWSLTSGGSVDVNNFPLAQDTAIFDTGTTTGTHTVDVAWNIGNLDMSALNVAVTLATGGQQANIHGDVTLDADVTLTGTGTLFFNGASNQTVTSAGVTFTQPLNINKPTTTSLILGDALTSNLGFTLTRGTLNLNDFDLTCFNFNSGTNFVPNSNIRSIVFDTAGKISCTGNNTQAFSVWPATNFSSTGTSNIELTYSGATGARQILLAATAAGSFGESNALNIRVLAGSDVVFFLFSNAVTAFRNLIFEDAFSGTFGDGSAGGGRIGACYGDIRFSSNMLFNLFTTSVFSWSASSGVQTITTNGQTLDFPVTKEGAGTLQLLDNLTIGSTRTLLHTAGTIDLNDNTLTTGVYTATGSDARSIDFGTGTLAVGGNFTASGSNYTTTGTGSINMTSASGKTFAGGGFTYPTLNQGGAGTLTITGANTFNNISNTNATASTITFPANTITRVLNMKLRGSLGNLVSMRSSIDGTTYTIQT